MSKLLELLTTAAVKSSSTRGRTITIRFGTNDIRDLSDGEFPVVVVRCNKRRDGTIEHTDTITVKARSRFKREVNYAAKGSYSGFVEQWVEIRTPAERANRAALSSPGDITT